MGVAGKDKYDIKLVEPDVSPLQVQGPKSNNVMVDLFGSWINDLKYYWCKETELDGIPVVVSRTGWSGEIGYEVYLRDGKRGAELYEKIMAAGESYKIAPTGPSQIRRVEAGIFSYFQDMRVTDNPYEIGMDRLVDLDMEADFCGKEALKKINAEGIKRKLVGIEILGDPITMIVPPEYTPGYFVPDHWPVHDPKGKEIGYVTSKCFSPRLQKNIAYAFVPIEHAEQGTNFFIHSPYAKMECVVVDLPFWDPKKQIPIGKV
jgi:aminomethyltransferase